MKVIKDSLEAHQHIHKEYSHLLAALLLVKFLRSITFIKSA